MIGVRRISLTLILLVFVSSAVAQQSNFTASERTIIHSVIGRFKKECPHISALDSRKIKEIQSHYQNRKSQMAEQHQNCFGEFLSQLVGTHNIHTQTCDEITPKKNYGRDRDLARLFVNVRKFQDGIKSYHERLNECLIRRGASPKDIIVLSDYEENARLLSKKVRDIDLSQPFKENSVNYR